MGVTGLKTFIENNSSRFLIPSRLHNTKLVIDGAALKYELYYRSSGGTKDYIFGGDFAWYATECRRFFNMLKRCKVRPIVVFDGAVCSSEKLDTLLVRAKSTFSRVKNISTKGSFKGKILPNLTALTMFTVMKEMRVEFVQATGEADQQIAAIANQLGCPVLSPDTDFFIFDLKGGLILIESLDPFYNTNRIVNPKARSQRSAFIEYIDCMFYHVDNLVAQFPGLSKNMLPLFSCLIGNDYVPRLLNKINTIDKQSLTQVKDFHVIEQHEQLVLLLNWMRDKTVEEVIELFQIDQSKKGQQRLRLSTDTYDIEEVSELSKHLSMLRHSPSKYKDRTKDICLPTWFVQEFNKGKLNSWLMDVVVNKRLLLFQDVQNLSWPSTHQFASSLRRIMYGLLRVNDDEDTVTIEEYDRVEDHYLKMPPAQPTLYLNDKRLPNLNEIRQIDMEQRMALMLEILKTEPEFMEEINMSLGHLNRFLTNFDPLRFVLLTIKYWVNEADVPVWIEFVYALLFNLFFGAHIERSINPRFFKYLIAPQETARAVSNLSPFWYRKTGYSLYKKGTLEQFEPTIVHFFSQFKICFTILISLNSLLGLPFDIFKFPLYFLNATFLYNLTLKLKSIGDLKAYLKHLTGRVYYDIIEEIINVLVTGLDDSQIMRRDNRNNNYKETTRKTTENMTNDYSFEKQFAELAIN